MVYRFLLLSDEVENFERIIEIDSEATFIDFRDIILKSVGYTNSNLTTFYICSEDWEKEQEILQMEMDSDSSVDTYLMDSTHIDEFIEDMVGDSFTSTGNDDWKEAAWQRKLRRQSKVNLRRRKR